MCGWVALSALALQPPPRNLDDLHDFITTWLPTIAGTSVCTHKASDHVRGMYSSPPSHTILGTLPQTGGYIPATLELHLTVAFRALPYSSIILCIHLTANRRATPRIATIYDSIGQGL